MKIMNCPLNGPRNVSEFAYGGEVQEMPAPDADVRDWADYVFIENNRSGRVREWWIHLPTSYWFIAERDTETNEVVATHPPGQLFTQRVEFGRDA